MRTTVTTQEELDAAPERPMPERAPIPTEPTGFGAIVRDVDGDHRGLMSQPFASLTG